MKNKKQRRGGGTLKGEVAIFVGEQVSVASVKFGTVYGLGEAKRMPGDVWDEKVGGDLALGRALRDASDQLLEPYRVKDTGTAVGDDGDTEAVLGEAVLGSGGDVE